MKRKLFILFGIMLFMTIAGSILVKISSKSITTELAQREDKLQVVTSFYPVYMIGLNLAEGIDNMEVKSLTDLKTGCLHDYQLTTEDMKIISAADVMIINGGGMEGFLNDIMSNYPKLTIINASEGIEMLPSEEEHTHEAVIDKAEAPQVMDGAEAYNASWNAHVWLDPQLYIQQIENITNGLNEYIMASEAGDSAMADRIRSNSDRYIGKITELDRSITEIADAWSGENKAGNNQAVIFHDSFAYLARRIGLDVAHAIPLDSDTSLSAGEIGKIVDEVKSGDIKYLFTEEQFSDSIASQIAAETGATESIIDSAVTGDGSKDSYLKAMKKNIQTLKKLVKY
jgi:zinc transport system substrate-binding protein